MKLNLFFVACFLFAITPTWGAVFGEYSNDGVVDINDVVMLLARTQADSAEPSVILTRAKKLFSNVSGNVINLPTITNSDFNKDGIVDVHDVVILLAATQVGLSDDAVILARSKKIFSNVNGNVISFPGSDIGSSSVPVSIGDPDNPIVSY